MLLEVKNLSVAFNTDKRVLNVIQDISFDVREGEIHSLVGESGCGKTVTSLALSRLLPANITSYQGEVVFRGDNLLQIDNDHLRSLRGKDIAYIFQDPFTSLNPLQKISEQIIEPWLVHKGPNRKEAVEKAVYLLNRVGVTDINERMNSYPSQMSGGILQRISIAMALMCDPVLLVADEPTSAIDVTIQAQFIDLLLSLKKENNMAILFISHDMGLVANISDRISVMYAGNIVETGTVDEVIDHTLHPYTGALIASLPSLSHNHHRLTSISGIVPSPEDYPAGCHFANRCSRAMEICTGKKPEIRKDGTHESMCHLKSL